MTRILERPVLSVVVPAHDDALALDASLAALCDSDLPRDCWELIVVDDASGDGTAIVAAQYADTVVRLAAPARGPGYARNRGFEAARADVVAFVHPRVRVRPDALRAMVSAFALDPDLAALAGTCEPVRRGGSLASRYGDLLVAYDVRCIRTGSATGFWSGCSAVRRHAFLGAGGFDEWHGPEMWTGDLDLTLRLHRRGHTVIRRGDVRGVHVHPWSFVEIFVSAFWRRAFSVAWSLPLGAAIAGRADGRAEARSLMVLGASFVLLAAGIRGAGATPLAAALAGVGIVLGLDSDFFRFVVRNGGPGLALFAVPAQLLRYVVLGTATMAGWLARALVGPPKPPITLEALAAAGVPVWPPAPVPPGQRDR